MPDNVLHRARRAFEACDWRAAHEAFAIADGEDSLACEDLQRFATAAFLVGRDLEFLRHLARSFSLHSVAGRATQAARDAFWLALIYLFRGDVGQSNAWVERGRRLVDTLDCAERGYLQLPVIELVLQGGNAATAHAMAAEASATGARHHDADLLAAARHVQGRAAIRLGDVTRALTLLDETMLAVTRGELSPIMTGLMYCSVIGACNEVREFGRACEWTRTMSGWCDRQFGMVAFTDSCLVHRAEIMQFQGAWQDALIEARRACERCTQGERRPPGAALYLQGEVHRQRGDFASAETAYHAASQAGFEPQPGLALLRTAQGRTDAAAASIRRLVSATNDRPQRARLLPAHVSIMLQIGDLEEAQRACEELEELSEVLCTDVMRALCAQSRGETTLRHGDARTALPLLRRAFEYWNRLDCPYEAARVRVRIGEACRMLGDEEAGMLENDAARTAFERLGAGGELARLDSSAGRPDCTLTPRELEVLRLIAEGQTNKGVANALGVSERTVDRHVSNILGKLGVASRAAATAYACSRRLF